MAQTAEGALKINAKRHGMSVQALRLRLQTESWCFRCLAWKPIADFGIDRTRSNGITRSCRPCTSISRKASYVPTARTFIKGRRFTPPRDGDFRQARRRINYYVETGMLLHPNSIPCIDCGNVWRPGGPRHEYDHHLGYKAEHHDHVEAVCSPCHHRREKERQHAN